MTNERKYPPNTAGGRSWPPMLGNTRQGENEATGTKKTLPDKRADQKSHSSLRSVEPPQISLYKFRASPAGELHAMYKLHGTKRDDEPKVVVPLQLLPQVPEKSSLQSGKSPAAASPSPGNLEPPKDPIRPLRDGGSALGFSGPSSSFIQTEAIRNLESAGSSDDTLITAPTYQGEIEPPWMEINPPRVGRILSANNSFVDPAALRRNGPSYYDIDRPTCSLNLVCYRSGAGGCDLQQIQCILRSRFSDEGSFQAAIDANERLVNTDFEFFSEMQAIFRYQMSSFFRRHFSLKSHKAFRILAYTPTKRPTIVPLDDMVLQEMMYAYRNPHKLESNDEWIQWVFRLRRKDKRHAIEFVEGWNTTRIAIAGSVPWLISWLVGIIWAASRGDSQTAFTIASFILTSSSILLALLAIISSVESAGRTMT
ncbi:Fc.00g040820.m01.CDS01 [Cosmosporella sp. VM-42]